MLCSRQDVFVLPLKPLSIKYPAKNFGFRLFNESCGDCDVAGNVFFQSGISAQAITSGISPPSELVARIDLGSKGVGCTN